MVLGEFRTNESGGMYSAEDLEVRSSDLAQLPQQLAAATAELAAQAHTAGTTLSPAEPDPQRPTFVEEQTAQREGMLDYDPDTGGFTRIQAGRSVPFEVPKTRAGEVRELVGLRDTVVALLEQEHTQQENTDTVQQLRAQLNERYDAYVARYGPINRVVSRRTGRVDPETGQDKVAYVHPPAWGKFRHDSYAPAVAALEHFDATSHTASKADVFHQRVIAPRSVATQAASPADALAISMDAHAEVRIDEVAALLDTDPATARAQLGTLVFDDPEEPGRLVPAAEYLSGNVRAKLATARAAAADEPAWQGNVDALAGVLPADLEPEQIHVALGTPWIGADDVQAFLRETLEDSGLTVKAMGGGVWDVTGARRTLQASQVWGTEKCPAPDIAENLLEQRKVLVHDTIGTKQLLNGEATAEAQTKAEQLNTRFAEWCWEDPERATRLAETYNDRFNAVVLRSYDDVSLSLPGLVESFTPRPHQVAAVARMIHEPSVMLDHEVGAGKTAEMVMGVMEQRRLGLIQKPAIVVPNHMLDQFSREWKQLYPRANLLVATKEDFAKHKRREFVARCATGNWDAVVITRSAFERIPISRAVQEQYRENEVAHLRAQRDQARENGTRQSTVKKLEKQVENAEQRMAELVANAPTDPGLTFESTGIDYLVVDEAHGYKNLRTHSNIRDAKIEGSNRASDLHMKLDYLRDTRGGRAATFATATPIANSVTELYVMQRYLSPQLLHEAGIDTFDEWAATFGQQVTEVEVSPDAGSFRTSTRFARFQNMPELLSLWRVVADVKTAEDLNLPAPQLPVIDEDGNRGPETVLIPPSSELQELVGELGARAERIRQKDVEPDQDNMLSVTGDGRKAALDLRLVDPDLQADAPAKLDYAADTITGIWRDYRETYYRDPLRSDGTLHPTPGALQIVFADLGTPKKDGSFSAYDELKTLLVDRGIPRDSIRAIHEANTDQAKAELFDAARKGQVSVLIGSTDKMGIGTNVQDRAIALHHLDCPWKPAELHQREGRLIRQGNQHDEVRVLRYITEQSFDAYNWQTIARKAGMIHQTKRGDLESRTIEDFGDAQLSATEAKALATGNPLMLEQAQAQSEVTRLERQQRSHERQQARYNHIITTADRELPSAREHAEHVDQLRATRVTTRGDAFTITLTDRNFDARPGRRPTPPAGTGPTPGQRHRPHRDPTHHRHHRRPRRNQLRPRGHPLRRHPPRPYPLRHRRQRHPTRLDPGGRERPLITGHPARERSRPARPDPPPGPGPHHPARNPTRPGPGTDRGPVPPRRRPPPGTNPAQRDQRRHRPPSHRPETDHTGHPHHGHRLGPAPRPRGRPRHLRQRPRLPGRHRLRPVRRTRPHHPAHDPHRPTDGQPQRQ